MKRAGAQRGPSQVAGAARAQVPARPAAAAPKARAATKARAALAGNHARIGPPARAAGEPLSTALRARLAPVLGAPAVEAARVHTDDAAHAIAASRDAAAVADGAHIYFAAGTYRPNTDAGLWLLAHEVAHVAQALVGTLVRPAARGAGMAHAAAERQADAAAFDVAAGAQLPDRRRRRRPPRTDEAATPALPPIERAVAPRDVPAAPRVREVAPSADTAAPPAASVVARAVPVMPVAARSLSRAERRRVDAVQARAGATGAAHRAVPTPRANVDAARAGVTPPVAERTARAAGELVTRVAAQTPPSPAIEALCERIRMLIRERRPASRDAVLQSHPAAVARDAGGEVRENVQGDVQQTRGAMDELQSHPTPAPAVAGTPVAPLAPATITPPVAATEARPDAAPERAVSLDADRAEMDHRAEDAGLHSETAQAVQSGPIAQARDAREGLEQTARTGPADARAAERAVLAGATHDLAALQARATAALAEARETHGVGVAGHQTAMVGSEEQMRARAGADAEAIFTNAQQRVETLLEPVSATAMRVWEEGLRAASQRFDGDLADVKRRLDQRHSGVGGAIVQGWDWATGAPAWVSQGYDRAERNFGEDVCRLLHGISSGVNAVIERCDGIVRDARDRIGQVFTRLPASLAVWAAQQSREFGMRLGVLGERVQRTRTEFDAQLVERAGTAVQQARERVQQLRQAVRGAWNRFTDALREFARDPWRSVINGLLELVGIPHASFWALVERVREAIPAIARAPRRFSDNLLRGVGQGFERFWSHFGQHLLQGLLTWLFTPPRAVPQADGPPRTPPPDIGTIEVPREFSARGVFSFFLQLMGITWTRIRRLLVEQLGERDVARGERIVTYLTQAFDVVRVLMRGPAGIAEWMREHLDPDALLAQVLRAAIDYVVGQLVRRAGEWLATLLVVPAGAILRAVELIYHALRWVFTNARQIFSFVETVVNGITRVLAGDIAGMATSVEQALVRLLPVVIDLFAEITGLSALRQRVRETVGRLQGWVEGHLRRAVTWVVARARPLLECMGFGRPEQRRGGPQRIGTRVDFRAGREAHQLWIDVQGNDARLMVASDSPRTIAQRLDWFGENLDERHVPSPQQRDIARGLIPRARALAVDADQDADRLVREFREQESRSVPATPTPTSNTGEQHLEAEEETLAGLLSRLFEIFDVSPSVPNGSPGDPYWIIWHKPDLSEYGDVELPNAVGGPVRASPTTIRSVTILDRRTVEDRLSGYRIHIAIWHGRLGAYWADARLDPEAATADLRTREAIARGRQQLTEAEREAARAERKIGEVERQRIAEWRDAYDALIGMQRRIDSASFLIPRIAADLGLISAEIARLAALLGTEPSSALTITRQIGVAREYQPRVGLVVGPKLMRVRDDTGKRAFVRFLRDGGFVWTGKEAEHVIDNAFSGPDVFENLWPLAGRNLSPNQTINKQTGKQPGLPGADQQGTPDLEDVVGGLWRKFFVIKRI